MRLVYLDEHSGAFWLRWSASDRSFEDSLATFHRLIKPEWRQWQDGKRLWRVEVCPETERGLTTLFTNFAPKLANIRSQIPLFPEVEV